MAAVSYVQGCPGGVMRHSPALEGRRLCPAPKSQQFDEDRRSSCLRCVWASITWRVLSTYGLTRSMLSTALHSVSRPPGLGSPGVRCASPCKPSGRGTGRSPGASLTPPGYSGQCPGFGSGTLRCPAHFVHRWLPPASRSSLQDLAL